MREPKPQEAKKKGWRKPAGAVCLLAGLAVNVLCLMVWMEAVCRDPHSLALVWLLEQGAFVWMSGILLLLITGALVFLMGAAAPAVFCSNMFFLLLTTVHRVKLDLRDDPLQFRDFSLAKEALTVAFNMADSIRINRAMIAGFVLMGLLAPLAFWGIRVLCGKPLRRIACAAALLAACVPCLIRMAATEADALFLIRDDYNRRGFMVAFADRLPCFDERGEVIERPQDYSRETVQAALAGGDTHKQTAQILPDILFVMSESLFDMADVFDLTEEPMPYFKQLQQEHWGGDFITPGYGGGTANVEYEVLTGYRSSDTPGYCFNIMGGAIRSDMDSVVSVLKEQGYSTEAIHPNTGSFYDRQNVYAQMGFDRLRFAKDMDPVPKTNLNYPPDDYLFDHIIRAYEERPADKPWFCHTVTYQNHGGYNFESDFTEIGVRNALDAQASANIHNYVNMVRLSDEALRGLISYFEAQERPVVIVIWGDHAPAITQFGLTLPSDPAAQQRYYTTPLLIWSNYGADFSSLSRRMSAYRVGASVLDALNIGHDPYFSYLAQAQTPNLTIFSNLIEMNGEFTRDAECYQQEQDKLKLLHYDRLLGERYGEGL